MTAKRKSEWAIALLLALSAAGCLFAFAYNVVWHSGQLIQP